MCQIIHLVDPIPMMLESPKSNTIWGSYCILKFLTNSKKVNWQGWLGSVWMPCSNPYVDMVLTLTGWMCRGSNQNRTRVSTIQRHLALFDWLVVILVGPITDHHVVQSMVDMWHCKNMSRGSASLVKILFVELTDLPRIQPYGFQQNKLALHHCPNNRSF